MKSYVKDKLAEFVWGEEFESMGNYDFLYAQMKNLRKKLKDFLFVIYSRNENIKAH